MPGASAAKLQREPNLFFAEDAVFRVTAGKRARMHTGITSTSTRAQKTSLCRAVGLHVRKRLHNLWGFILWVEYAECANS